MTFIGILKNGCRDKQNPDKGATRGGMVVDARKIFQEGEYETIGDRTEKLVSIAGLDYVGFIGWEGITKTVTNILKDEGRGLPNEMITAYGKRLQTRGTSHMLSLIKDAIRDKPPEEHEEIIQRTLRKYLCTFTSMVYDSSPNNSRVRIGYMKWLLGSNRFDFDHIDYWHYEVGRNSVKTAAGEHIDNVLVKEWKGKPEEELTNDDILKLLAGEFVQASKYPTVFGIPAYVTVDRDRTPITERYSKEEGCALTRLVGHWNWGIVHHSIWQMPKRDIWLYEQIEAIRLHKMPLERYRQIASVIFSSVEDVMGSYLTASQLDDKLNMLRERGRLTDRGVLS